MSETTSDDTANDDRSGISIHRHVAASPEAVYAAWTDPASFAHWFGTAATTVMDVSMDVTPGGSWAATMSLPDGSRIDWSGVYREVQPGTRLVLTLQDRPGADSELVTVGLTSSGEGTDMTFTQVGGHLSAQQYAQAQAGWETFFADLAALVERAPA